MASSRKPEAESVAERVARVLAPRIHPGRRLTAALSGGADSVALLHLLRALAPRLGYVLSALHVNHGISPRAPQWEAFCRDLCADWRVPFSAVAVAVAPHRALGLEAAAREARYRAFAAADTDFLALAHHRDDQAETLLLQLLRGAGPRGAAGMPSERAMRGSPVRLLRPLLEVPRQALRGYAADHGLRWIEDESNADAARARGFVRQVWLPAAEARFAGSVEALARAARLQGEAALLLEDLAAIDGAGALEPGRLPLDRLAGLPRPRGRNLLRHFLGRHGVIPPPSRRLEEFLRQALSATADARVGVDLPGWHLWVWRGAVWLCPRVAAPAAPLAWDGAEEISLGPGLGRLRLAATSGGGLAACHVSGQRLVVRWRAGGERLRLAEGAPRRALKALWQERGVPPWMRQRLPLVYVGDRLAWAAGGGVAWEMAARPGEPAIAPAWIPEPGFGPDGRPLAW